MTWTSGNRQIDNLRIASSDALTVQEFNELLSRSKQLFNCLRDMPQMGIEQWEPYFARTFQVFSQLWKFQQVHRKDDFIADTLLREMKARISLYLQEDDAASRDWLLLAKEIEQFVHSDRNIVRVKDMPDSRDSSLRLRLPSSEISANHFDDAYAARCSALPLYKLEQAVIASCLYDQVKVSELTINMFRILQTIERAPQIYDGTEIGFRKTLSSTEDEDAPQCRLNPRKLLLYKPSISSLLAGIATTFRDCQPYGVLLVYIAALGHLFKNDGGGLLSLGIWTVKCLLFFDFANHIRLTHTRRPSCESNSVKQDPHILSKHDFIPFTRKPMVLIIDSSNGGAKHFQDIEINRFNQPILVLLSPNNLPSKFQSMSANTGDLLTMFLSCPIQALCCLVSPGGTSVELTQNEFDDLSRRVEAFQREVRIAIEENEDVNNVFRYFVRDVFLCSLITRFFLCFVALSMDNRFDQSESSLPTCVPSLGINILHVIGIRRLIRELVDNVRSAINGIREDEMSLSYVEAEPSMEPLSSSSKLDISSV
ncbi:hypothetical protein ACOME3_009650 [Neoechinorhynchus agilis]